MTRIYVLIVSGLLGCASAGEAHALDEYLQATRLDLARDRVVVELDLTPGVAVAARVLAWIDRDRNLRVTPPEIEAYGRRVLADLSLQLDGRDYPLTLVHAESPSWEEMRDGEGTIRLVSFARVTLTGENHRIRYQNIHQRDSGGVYLVNVLVPSTRDLAIRAQHRDRLQYGIDVDLDVHTPLDTAAWWMLPIAGLTAVLVMRHRDRRR